MLSEFYAGALKFQKDSKLIPQANGSVIFYVGNDFQWNGTILVHQDTKVTWVSFLCESVNSVLSTKKSLDSSTIEGFFVYECLKLKLNFARLCIPNFFSVFFNGSVRAELAHASHVENSFFSPSLCIEIFLSDFFMTFYIAAEIG